MNTFKKTGGFTLVELIIVIAILAILSSVAVAGYSSYIGKANDSAVSTELNNIVSAATLANAAAGSVDEITVVYANEKITITVKDSAFAKDFSTDFAKAFNKTDMTKGEGTYTLEIPTKTNWTASSYATSLKWTAATNEWKDNTTQETT